MAEETTIKPENVVTAEAPRSSLSAADIVGPYQRLSQSLNKLGDSLEDMAVPLAERAGNPRLAYSREEQASDMGKLEGAVSYTHLTLPTKA